MRISGVLLVAALTGLAQTPSPLMRGTLVERDTQSSSGVFSVRGADSQLIKFLFDNKTYVEREDHLIDVRHLEPGEKIEVLSDDVPGSPLRYARTIHVILPQPPKRPQTEGRIRSYRPGDDRLLPTGNLTYSGYVARVAEGLLMLHTRDAGDQAILLRKDTRYMGDGKMVDLVALKPHMRVFVRAGKNAYDQVEAYQVVWGTILEPK